MKFAVSSGESEVDTGDFVSCRWRRVGNKRRMCDRKGAHNEDVCYLGLLRGPYKPTRQGRTR